MKLSLSKIIFGIFLVILAAIFITGFLILNHSANPMTEKQKEQALSKILGRPAILNEKYVPVGEVMYKGKYMTFLYPAAAVKYVQTLNGKPIQSTDLEDFSFDMDNPKMYIVTEVVQAPSLDNITDDPGVRMRQVDTVYKQTKLLVDGQSGLVFEKTDNNGFEKTGFFLVRNKFYSFSIVSNDAKAAGDLFDKIILSLKFL